MGINSGPKVEVDPAHTNGTYTNGVKAKKPAAVHPLGPLSPEEISRSSSLLAQSWPEGTLFKYKSIVLREPSKAELLPYLGAERSGKELPSIDRLSDVIYYIKNTVCLTATKAVLPCANLRCRTNSMRLLST
jgi:primary-amine oxidase